MYIIVYMLIPDSSYIPSPPAFSFFICKLVFYVFGLEGAFNNNSLSICFINDEKSSSQEGTLTLWK